ncbi:MAG TPA: choline/ethanolamine kinase family protein [Steroidobacteraceae bacterium]
MTGAQGLARALEHVPGCEGGTPARAVRVLTGGSINQSIRVDTASGSFVVRLAGVEAERLGVDRRREALLHGIAAAAGLAPRIVFAAPDASFLVTQWIDGRVWAPADLGDAAQLRKIAACLGELHALTAPRALPGDASAQRAGLDLLGEVRGYAAQIIAGSPREAPALAQLLARAQDASDRAGSVPRAPAIVHNDLHHANLVHADRVYLLDWEYANIGDPLLDLASLLSYNPQAQPHAALLLQDSGLAELASLQSLRELTWLFVLDNYLWYRARRLHAEPSGAERAAEDAARSRLASP